MPSPSAHERVGRYRIKEQLAAGGMGVVYRAVDQLTGEECALKRIKPEALRSAHGIESFEREYQVLAGINHPRIIRVHDYGVDEAGPYYTMELVEGDDLRTLAPLDYRDACRYLRDVATSLALLHARRLLHRDLSPRNVRLTPDGHCRLLDFGALSEFGPSSLIVGTPPAIAPEAAQGAVLDQRTDLYALGALAYWLLTRQHAYPAKRIDELPELWQRLPEPPSSLVEGIPPQLDELVLSLLDQNPLARPASAAAVVARLSVIGELEAEDEEDLARLATSFLATPHLVGRSREMAELGARIELAVGGRGGAVAIEGAAGTGRTRLLEEVGVVAQLAGAHVLRVDAGMHRQPNGTARALVRQLLDTLPVSADTTARLSPAAIAQVGEIETRMRLRHSLPVPGTRADPSLAGGVSLESWLAEVSCSTPLLVEVDNVEYADDPSLGLLAALARGAGEQAVLIVVTHKPVDPAQRSVGLAALQAHCTPMALAALSEQETTELARSLFGDASNLARFAEFLYSRTAGNPLHCLEISRQLVAKRVIRYLEGNWALPAERPDATLSSALEGALAARLAALSDQSRQLAECLSLHRGELSTELCRRLVSKGADRELFALLDELARNDVLYSGEGGCRFSTTALQDALLAGMDDAAREQGHRRLGEALFGMIASDQHARRIQAGWHLLRGGEQTRGADLIAAVACDSVAVRLVFTDLHGAGAALEAALKVYRRQRRTVYQQLPLLSALAQAGYYEDRRWGELYGDQALDVLEDLSGLRAARSLRRFLGGFLGLVVGLGYAWLRFALAPRRDRGYGFGEILIQLFGAVTCLTAVAVLGLDAERARFVAGTLAPFAVLPERTTPVGIYQFCQSLRQIALENQAEAFETFERLLKRFGDPRYYPTLPQEARGIYLAGVHFARAVFATYRGDGRAALESADALDALDLKFYAMIASEMRFLYYMNRGDFQAAAQHRQQVDIHAAHVGSAWQVEQWEPAALIPVYAWLQDVDGMARVADRLELLAQSVPSLRYYASLARWAQGLVLSDESTSTNAVAIARLEQRAPRSYIGWAAHMGFTAMGSRFLGNHDVARQLSRTAAAHLTDGDREYVTLFLMVDIECAWSEAALGHVDQAIQQLDALLQRNEDSGHPLALGLLHEARALIAHQAGRTDLLAHSAHEAERWLRSTGNPALIARCERLARLQARGRPASGRREGVEVERWLGVLAEQGDTEQRVSRALQLLREAARAEAVAFYRREGDGFELEQQSPGEAFSAGECAALRVALGRFDRGLRTQTAASVTRTQQGIELSAGSSEDGTRRCAYFVLGEEQGSIGVVGAVALSLGRDAGAPPPGLLSALGRSLGWDEATVVVPTLSVTKRSGTGP